MWTIGGGGGGGVEEKPRRKSPEPKRGNYLKKFDKKDLVSEKTKKINLRNGKRKGAGEEPKGLQSRNEKRGEET